MVETHTHRLGELQQRLKESKVSGGLVSDPETLFWLTGYWGYASLNSCGRPNLLWVPVEGEPEIVTPAMEAEMCRNLSSVSRLREWVDGIDGEWMTHLRQLLSGKTVSEIAIEKSRIPGMVLGFLTGELPNLRLHDLGPVLGEMRSVKTPEEIIVMRQAGQVAIAMADAGQKTIRVGIPEYEISLAVVAAGTRKAAELMSKPTPHPFFSPMIHNLQILQSGKHTCMVHRRPTTRCVEHGDPVYMCFCGITVYKGYWLGFDREYFCGAVSDEQAMLYETTIRAQLAALAEIKSGAVAEDVHFAADEVYQMAGFPPTYRTGRGTGSSILEGPELKAGEKTILKPGMTFAVDGGLTVPGSFGARVGDSVVVTKNGFEYLTPYPKDLTVL
jgi:Xaa-Pro dipeptidase